MDMEKLAIGLMVLGISLVIGLGMYLEKITLEMPDGKKKKILTILMTLGIAIGGGLMAVGLFLGIFI